MDITKVRIIPHVISLWEEVTRFSVWGITQENSLKRSQLFALVIRMILYKIGSHDLPSLRVFSKSNPGFDKPGNSRFQS